MTDRIDDLVQKIDNVTYKIMLGLEDRVVNNNDRASRISLDSWCNLYGLTAREFIEWCEN